MDDVVQVDKWYTEVVEMFRKLIMSSILIFLWPESLDQLAAGLVVTIGFLIWSDRTCPFCRPELGHVYTFALLAQAATILCKLPWPLHPLNPVSATHSISKQLS